MPGARDYDPKFHRHARRDSALREALHGPSDATVLDADPKDPLDFSIDYYFTQMVEGRCHAPTTV